MTDNINPDKKEKDTGDILKVKTVLAEQLGTEPEEIKNEDNLQEDLHMQPSDLFDFVQKLEATGYDTQKLDLGEVKTLTDLFINLDIEVD